VPAFAGYFTCGWCGQKSCGIGYGYPSGADGTDTKSNQWIKVFGATDPKAKVLVAEEVELTKEPKTPYL
jgi:cellulase/cellobiase CelA1